MRTWGCINGTCGEIPQISGDVRIPSIGVCPKYQIYKKAKTQQILNLKHNRTFYA